MGIGKFNAGLLPCNGQASKPGGSRNLLSQFMLQNQDKLWPDVPLGLYGDLLKGQVQSGQVKYVFSHTSTCLERDYYEFLGMDEAKQMVPIL